MRLCMAARTSQLSMQIVNPMANDFVQPTVGTPLCG